MTGTKAQVDALIAQLKQFVIVPKKGVVVIAFIHADVFYDWDHLRHFMAWAFNPDNWFTNASEQMIAAVVVVVVGTLLWPRIRHPFEGWSTARSWATSRAITPRWPSSSRTT